MALCCVIGGFYLLKYLLTPKHASCEPPILSPRIPFIGHALGLLTEKANYFITVRYFPASRS